MGGGWGEVIIYIKYNPLNKREKQMLEEFSKTVKSQLYERASSPLLGSFIIAWCIWNHRFIMVIFSELSFQEKITYIDFHVFGGWPDSFINGIIIPLIAALFMIIIYPWPARFLYGYWRIQQNKIKSAQQKIDGDVLLSADESREIRQAEIKAKIEFDALLRSKNEEIASLREIIEAMNNQLLSRQAQNQDVQIENKPNDELSDSQMKLLNVISNSGFVYKDEVIGKSEDRLGMKFDFGELLNRKLISENYVGGSTSDYKVEITHEGTTRLIEARGSSKS